MSSADDMLRSLDHPVEAELAPPRHPVPLPSRSATGDLAWMSVGAASLVAADIAGAPLVDLDPVGIAVAYTSERHGRVDGSRPIAFAPLSGFFRTRDGWVRTHGNYPHHARALTDGLGLEADAGVERVVDALAVLTTSEAVDAVSGAGGVCAAVAEERPEDDAALRTRPLVAITPLGAAPPRPLQPTPGAPLAGVRVLDLTRVIAGPVATRTLALLGADVLRIDPPRLPEIGWQHLDTGHGKRSALLDLGDAADRARFDRLAESADVIVLGYRPDGLARLGLSPAMLAARHPGLVIAQLSAWGTPDRRGFDSIVQAESGISLREAASDERPGALPAQALDHSAGYLLATSVMVLLARRAREGGSWLAETSLRRVAAELLGMPHTAQPASVDPVDARAHTQTFEVDGAVVTTAAPAISSGDGPLRFSAPRPWGRDEAGWQSDGSAHGGAGQG